MSPRFEASASTRTPRSSSVLSVNSSFSGEGGVTVLDGRTVTMSNVAEEDRDRTISLFGVTLRMLSQGDRFDLRSRRPEHHSAEEIEQELGLDSRDGAAERRSEKSGAIMGQIDMVMTLVA
jgi:hypothetical protein